MIKDCNKLWGYHNEHDIDREIAFAYNSLRDAIKMKNEPMTLRFLSINLYEKYQANPDYFELHDRISDVSILNCNFLDNKGGRVKNE